MTPSLPYTSGWNSRGRAIRVHLAAAPRGTAYTREQLLRLLDSTDQVFPRTFITCAEAADIFALTPRQVQYAARERAIATLRSTVGRVLYSYADLRRTYGDPVAFGRRSS